MARFALKMALGLSTPLIRAMFPMLSGALGLDICEFCKSADKQNDAPRNQDQENRSLKSSVLLADSKRRPNRPREHLDFLHIDGHHLRRRHWTGRTAILSRISTAQSYILRSTRPSEFIVRFAPKADIERTHCSQYFATTGAGSKRSNL
jgi:hypothetical protein